MRYQLVRWHHDHADEPVLLYSEVAADGYEVRKVDEYRNGNLAFADETIETDSTRLGDQVMPSIAEINSDDEFTAEEIDQPTFEKIVARACRAPEEQGLVCVALFEPPAAFVRMKVWRELNQDRFGPPEGWRIDTERRVGGDFVRVWVPGHAEAG